MYASEGPTTRAVKTLVGNPNLLLVAQGGHGESRQWRCRRARSQGLQLTWMDAKVDDWAVTRRIGKPVEVNALWAVAAFAWLLGGSPDRDQVQAAQARAGFARFWNENAGCCYDVPNGPDGDDPSIRPEQLFAVSLPHSPCPQSSRRPWSMPVRGTSWPPAACAVRRRTTRTARATTVATGARRMRPTIRARCGAG